MIKLGRILSADTRRQMLCAAGAGANKAIHLGYICPVPAAA